MGIREFREVFVREMSKLSFYESWHSGCDHYGPMLQGYSHKPKDGTCLGPLWTISLERAGKDRVRASVTDVGRLKPGLLQDGTPHYDSDYLPPDDDARWKQVPERLVIGCFEIAQTFPIGEDPAATSRQIIAWFANTKRGAFVADYLPWDFLA